MELLPVIILIVALGYLTKNSRGKQILDNVGDTAVELSAAAKSASTALHKQCDELLQPDSDEDKAALKAKIKPAKAKAAKKDLEDLEDAL